MAAGDDAGAKGLATYSDSLLVKDIDTALNTRGDETAATMTRLDGVEAAVNQPIFSVQRSTATASFPNSSWRQVIGQFAATPDINEGMKWSPLVGQLEVVKGGIYRVTAHAFFATPAPDAVGLQVTRNSELFDTAATILGAFSPGRGCDLMRLVRLVPGDVLRVFIQQRSADGANRIIEKAPNDLTLTAEWVRA